MFGVEWIPLNKQQRHCGDVEHRRNVWEEVYVYLEGVDGAVVSSEGIGDFLLWSLGLSVAGEDHPLLRAHHELGRLLREREREREILSHRRVQPFN